MIFVQGKHRIWQPRHKTGAGLGGSNRFRVNGPSALLSPCACRIGLEKARCAEQGLLSFYIRGPLSPRIGRRVVVEQTKNPKVAIEDMELGKGLLALQPIEKDEIIAAFDGNFYHKHLASEIFPKETRDHAVQIGPHTWRDSIGIARLANHSCEPNLGIRGVDTLVAMRDIEAGERLTWDYEMTECSDWRMRCMCGARLCRGVIGSYDNMPDERRRAYGGYISKWLRKDGPTAGNDWRAAA